MSDFKFESLKLIQTNDKNVIKQICTTLVDLLSKIILNPDSNEYRRIDLLSNEIVNNLMPHEGGLHSLFEVGFIESDDSFVLPEDTNLKRIEVFLEQLKKFINKGIQAPACETTIKESNVSVDCGGLDTANMSFKHRSFYSKLKHNFNHVLIYEDKNIQEKALRLIPYEIFRQNATEALNSLETNEGIAKINEKELILVDLLNWFKNEFFQWVNKPECSKCESDELVNFVENGEPSAAERNGWAGNVEIYFCSSCQQTIRFPRYNHPSVLLDTRRGRCGEWANCFALCLRALGYETRYIADWTDHVWCEVYLDTYKRWFHLDPCEAAFDRPLIYEHGWGKQLSYVVGFSSQEIIDVTWRYTSKYEEVLARRNECDEMWLVKLMFNLNKKRQANVNETRMKELQSRQIVELVEFLTPKKVKEGVDNVGRQSGSLQWRLSRGEMGDSGGQKQHIISLSEVEATQLELSLKYNTAKDTYSRGNQVFKSWNYLTSNYKNIQRKVENDWKMCYLSRLEGTHEASIEWCFDFINQDDIQVDKLMLRCAHACYEGGQIDWFLECDNNLTQNIQFNDSHVAIFDNVSEYRKFILKAELKGGSGTNAFQHTQLFRQKLNDFSDFLFEVIFKFSKK